MPRTSPSVKWLRVIAGLILLAGMYWWQGMAPEQAPAPESAQSQVSTPRDQRVSQPVLTPGQSPGSQRRSTPQSAPQPAPGNDTPSPTPSLPTQRALPGFLPPEAGPVLALIERGGPFPHRQDGSVFQNRERRLPQQPRGYYREYTVPTPGSRDRGARRIVTGGDPPREFWYSADHYRSFRRFEVTR